MRNYAKVDGKLTPEDVEHIVQEIVASSRLEGYYMSDEEIEMLRKYTNGEISDSEYTAWACKRAEVAP